MCGISGFNWPDGAKIRAMAEAMKSRGPDDEGFYVDDAISLGHRRLSIIDLSAAGHQPMEIDGRVIIYNGEIYNHAELRKELEISGAVFSTRTDTEVVLRAYAAWGPGCLVKFRGMFAFAIYEKSSSKLFLARDHIGIKPLYYWQKDGKFAFASNIKALIALGCETSPNRKTIRDFLLYNITDHTLETFFEGVMRLPKGHHGTIDLKSGKMELHRWWENKFSTTFKGTREEAAKKLRALMAQSVERHLVSDVPVGTCLSGGIDSSAVACLINDSRKTGMKTFTATFPGFERDESAYVDKINNDTGMPNHKISLSAEDISQRLAEFVRAVEEPVPGPAPFAQYMVFKLACDNGVTVLLDGQGADELFAGYHYFFGFYMRGLLRHGKLGSAIREIRARGGGKIGRASLGFLLMPGFYRERYFRKRSNVSRQLLAESGSTYAREYYSCKTLHSSLEFHLDFKLEHLLSWEDRLSMAHSREARVPFLDPDVMRFVFSLPEEYILSMGVTKTVLRDAMCGVVPKEILDRQDKIGFDTPESAWLRDGAMKAHIGRIVEGKPLCAPYVDLEKTRRMVSEHLSGRADHARAIWRTLMLEGWLREFFPGVAK